MLKVQEFLHGGGTLEELAQKYAIKATFHPFDPLVILNYDQIESPKMDPIVRECRGLVLEIGTWKLVAKAFDRFFNMEEAHEINKGFDWSDFNAFSKEDGSLILVYFYNGSWRVNTRGSFAEFNMHDCGKSWAELFWQALKLTPHEFHVIKKMGTQLHHTYVFEFCSIYNKVVREYKESKCYLIGVTSIINGKEFSNKDICEIADNFGFVKPETYQFKDIQDIVKFIEEQESVDPTWEGVVVRDKNGLRMKIKSKTYVALHHLKGNDNIFLTKNLLPFILAGETDEVLTYFPECKERIDEITEIVNGAYGVLFANWWHGQDIEEQKAFALYITKNSPWKTPFTGILFNLRKEHGQHQTQEQLKDAWRKSGDAILKFLF